jgi:hypothetical protein
MAEISGVIGGNTQQFAAAPMAPQQPMMQPMAPMQPQQPSFQPLHIEVWRMIFCCPRSILTPCVSSNHKHKTRISTRFQTSKYQPKMRTWFNPYVAHFPSEPDSLPLDWPWEVED